MSRDGVERFNDRVADYVRFRPGYPVGVAALITAELACPPPVDIVDVGAGTGKLTERLVQAGQRVYAVEPNPFMRAEAEKLLSTRSGVTFIDGTAEATGLPDECADGVTVAQAYHWFDADAARAEFRRILRPGGLVFLIWNDRRALPGSLLAEYDDLLRAHAPDYEALERRDGDNSRVAEFFAPHGFRETCFDNHQRLDWEGLRGRALSASYVPRDGPLHEAFFAGLRQAFEHHEVKGRIDFSYDTRVFHGRLD